MATKPGSEKTDLTVPDSATVGHPNESPEVWGWHGEWGGWTRVGGWVTAIIFLLMMTSTHYNRQGALFLGLGAGLIVVMLLIDRQRRKHSWRK